MFYFWKWDYLYSYLYQGEATAGQPTIQNYYHRSLSDIFKLAFQIGFVVDGFIEVPFENENTPIIMVVR